MKIYDYLDRELNIGDDVLVAVPSASMYKGRIMVITSKTIIIDLMGKFHEDGKIVFKQSTGWRRKIPLESASYEIFKLNEDG